MGVRQRRKAIRFPQKTAAPRGKWKGYHPPYPIDRGKKRAKTWGTALRNRRVLKKHLNYNSIVIILMGIEKWSITLVLMGVNKFIINYNRG